MLLGHHRLQFQLGKANKTRLLLLRLWITKICIFRNWYFIKQSLMSFIKEYFSISCNVSASAQQNTRISVGKINYGIKSVKNFLTRGSVLPGHGLVPQFCSWSSQKSVVYCFSVTLYNRIVSRCHSLPLFGSSLDQGSLEIEMAWSGKPGSG